MLQSAVRLAEGTVGCFQGLKRVVVVTVERHQDISARFLEQAEAELRTGDHLQASEKAWGAVAHYVKSVAADRGWPNETHRDVNRNARKLIVLTDEPELNTVRLGAINSLHQNFYEDWFDRGTVIENVAAADALLAALREATNRLPLSRG